MVQELCISAIMSISENINGNLVACYYDDIMPILKQLLVYTQSLDNRQLWGQTLECCAVVGEAAGKEKFHADALDMMRSLMEIQSKLDEDSDIRQQLLKTWVRIA